MPANDSEQLVNASRRGDAASVGQLLSIVDCNAAAISGELPLVTAVECGQWAVARLLLQAGAKLEHRDQSGISAWEWLITEMQFNDAGSSLLELMPSVIPVDFADKVGRTALMYAARASPVAVERLLLLKPALDTQDCYGVTALMLCCMSDTSSYDSGGGISIAGMLLNAGASPDIVDNNGLSAQSYCDQQCFRAEEAKAIKELLGVAH